MRKILLLVFVFIISTEVFDQNKELIQENTKTGEKVHIKPGSTVKFWYYSDKKSKLFGQPIERLDFNRHRNFVETQVLVITNSHIYFMRMPYYLPIPLPIPIKPKLDSVSFKSIECLRVYSSGAMGSVQRATMGTTMGLVPSSLNGYPMMLLLPFSSNILMSGIGAIIYPMGKLGGLSNYKIYAEDIPVDSNFLRLHNINMQNYNASDDEWDIDKHNRWEKVYNKVYRIMYDSLLFQNKDKSILSFHIGSFFIPDYVKGIYDKNTGVDISSKNFVLGLSLERFVTPKTRVGMEIMFHSTKPHMDMLTSGMSGGIGSVLSMFSFYKYEIGELFGAGYRNRIVSKLKTLNADTADEDIQNQIGWLKDKLVSRPKLYLLAGFGTVNTNLMRFSGSMDNMVTKDYSQKSIGIEGGAGIFTRLGKRLVYDMSLKYIWTPDYSPSIGSLYSYSGFKLQFNIGLITNSGFRKLKNIN